MSKKRLVSVLVLSMLVLVLSGEAVSACQPQGVTLHEEERNVVMNYTIDQLTQAVLENNISLVNAIIQSNTVDINGTDSEGQYPIEMVLIMNNCDMAKILLEAGANPHVITSDGISVYDKVMSEGSRYLKKIFRQYN